MERFLCRKNELESMEKLYAAKGFQMLVMYGRRRIGKSTLIKEFIKDKRAVYFMAVKSGLQKNIELFGKEVLKTLAADMTDLTFAGINELFSFIGRQCTDKRTVIVIDELPYIAETTPDFLSILQGVIDNDWINKQMFLILCGSSISFMEDCALSEKSPIYGRRTAQMKLSAFNYLESAEFVPEYNNAEKAVVYGITGGVAKYLSLFDDGKSLDENIMELYFSKTGYLYDEPSNLLLQEFRNVSMYSDIIGAVANGVNKVVEIADKIHMDSTTVAHALTNLLTTGILNKENAMTEESNKKKVLYRLGDGMFRFWYKFVPEGISAVELGYGMKYYERNVRPRIPEFMGGVFEDICRFYTLITGVKGELASFVTNVGTWWGSNPQTKMQTDIDVVALDRNSKKAIIGECKYKNDPIDKSILEGLLSKDKLLSGNYEIVQFILFSKSGFTKWVKENATEKNVILLTLDDLYTMT